MEREVEGFGGPLLVVVPGSPGDAFLRRLPQGVFGLGPGPAYLLRLVLDVPWRRDVVVEAPLQVGE